MMMTRTTSMMIILLVEIRTYISHTYTFLDMILFSILLDRVQQYCNKEEVE